MRMKDAMPIRDCTDVYKQLFIVRVRVDMKTWAC